MIRTIAFTLCLAVYILLSACSSSDKEELDAANLAAEKQCPRALVQIALADQRKFALIVDGVTREAELDDMPGLVRRATLVKAGEANITIHLYQMGVAGCNWVAADNVTEPVMLRDGVVIAHGMAAMDAMTEKGWRIKEAAWPWQRYKFSYVPSR
jgi:hypothetical protein